MAFGKTQFRKNSTSPWEKAMSSEGVKKKQLFPTVEDIERGVRRQKRR